MAFTSYFREKERGDDNTMMNGGVQLEYFINYRTSGLHWIVVKIRIKMNI